MATNLDGFFEISYPMRWAMIAWLDQ